MDNLNFKKTDVSAEANQYESLPTKMNLEALGYEEAGRNGGDSIAYANRCDLMVNREHVSEERDEVKQQAEQKKVEKEIAAVEQQKITAETKAKDLETVKMPDYERLVHNAKEEISELELDKAKDAEKGSKRDFDFWMIFPVFILTTVFLYVFYVSSFHNAIFRGNSMEKQLSSATSDNIAAVMNTVFNSNAFSEFNIHWIAPVIFFAFGIILHLMFKTISKWRYVSVVAMLLFIFFADGLLAYFIEFNNHKLAVLMGLDNGEWIFYKSPVFIIVLVMGFFTCMGWSILLHNLRDNMNPHAVIRKKISLLKKKIKEIEAQIACLKSEILKTQLEVKQLELQIESLKRDLEMIHYGVNELKLNINEFYSGWLRYIVNMSDKNKADRLKQECEAVKNRVIASLTDSIAA